ncbi:MAG: 30S ribosomal protein S14 [Candidatus Diapherotrites archaeon]|nr:30S ribosomal protein S14 [Candidatus Diapherotrites archaeon]
MKKHAKKRALLVCRNCNNNKGLIRKYGLLLCRRCFKEFALKIGFTKFD